MNWSERELEDFVCANPEWLQLPGFRLLGRQVPLPNGWIVDILGMNEDTGRMYVLELKAEEANGKALSQVLAYAAILKNVLLEHMTEPMREFTYLSLPELVIVAPSFTDRLLVASQHIPQLTLCFARPSWKRTFLDHEYIRGMGEGEEPEALSEAVDRIMGTAEAVMDLRSDEEDSDGA